MSNLLEARSLAQCADDHRDPLAEGAGTVRIWWDDQLTIMVIRGPHSLDTFHVNPSDEFFYQLEGDMTLEYLDAGGQRRTAEIRQGEALVVPASTPHSPQRPAGSLGLVVERTRDPAERETWVRYGDVSVAPTLPAASSP